MVSTSSQPPFVAADVSPSTWLRTGPRTSRRVESSAPTNVGGYGGGARLRRALPFWLLPVFACCFSTRAADVRINEILYHPSSEDVREEYLELYNRGTNTANLHGWRLTKGLSFTFTNVVLAPGAYLVVAADLGVFQATYPGVANVVGNWVGVLRNSGEEIQLEDASGQTIDNVRYANEGDWGTRRSGLPLSGTRGWEWFAEHDGLGKSLELIQPALPNQSGQNWGSSLPLRGTPGVANSLRSTNVAPLISEVQHAPLIPRSTDPISITARIRDETAAGLNVTLWRRDHSSTSPQPFESIAMADDGRSGDGLAGDGIYGVSLPPLPDQTVLEFYVAATDAGGQERTWPAPAAVAVDQSGPATQSANALLQVDEGIYTGSQPVLRLILTGSEWNDFQGIDRSSDAQMNATFVTVEGTVSQVRHQCGVRIRGAGSRFRTPPNYRLNIPNDQRWNGVDAINLNTQFVHSQLVGSHLAQRSGMVAANVRAVQVRVNGVNLAFATPAPGDVSSWQFGSYAQMEVLNGDWAANHFPDDGEGNIYRASSSGHSANLSYGTTPDYFLNRGYTKTSNQSENDWSDLIQLTEVLNNTPDSNYLAAVSQVVNVELWMRYFAVMSMLTSLETSIAAGRGDDYSMYRGVVDPRFLLLPHDLDTCVGEGDSGAQPAAPLFRMINLANPGANVQVLNRFMTHPALAPIYYRELDRMLETTFSPAQFDPLLDRLLGGWVPQPDIDRIKNYQLQRNSYVRSQISLTLTAASSLPVVNGYPQSTTGLASLNGRANVFDTRFVLVNGTPANYSAWQGTWTITGLALTPGLNKVVVEALDASSNRLQRVLYDINYNDASTVTVSGILSANTTWTAAAGPYHVTATLNVPAGVTLTIEPGTSVYFAAGAGLDVTGTLLAQGSPSRRIRFTRPPGTPGSWTGINIDESSGQNRIAHADFDYADAGAANITVVSSVLFLEDVTWANTAKTILTASGASVAVRQCTFPDLIGATHVVGNNIPNGGFFVIERSVFGSATQFNDIIRFRGAQRPGRVLQVLDNLFTAASDDVLDLDGSDAHVEGNLFLHVHRNHSVSGDTSSAIAFGRSAGYAPHIVAVRNLFYDVDHVALAKDGASLTLANNTAVGISVAALNLSEPGLNSLPAARVLVEGNIFHNPPGYVGTNFQNRLPTNGSVQLVLAQNIFSSNDGVTNGVGGNLLADPRLANTDPNTMSAASLRDDFRLRPGSPALGTGPNGLDRGGLVAAGASISGEPEATTAATAATLTVAGPGVSNYVFRVNAGPYGPSRPVTLPIQLSGLTDGQYRVEVTGINSAGVGQPVPVRSRIWTVDAGTTQLMLNEVLARNDSAVPMNGSFPDLIELHNPGVLELSLAGVGVSDDPQDPYKFQFPPDAVIAPGQYLVLVGGDGPGPSLGFTLRQEGGAVYLRDGPLASGALLDSVAYGPQVPDLSIGRLPGGGWTLTRPTFGAPNAAQPTGDPALLRLNEWLAFAVSAFSSDFLELYNGDVLPVGLGGLFLTDEPAGAPRRHLIAPLSYAGPGAHVLFRADDDAGAGADHVGFRLAPEQGMLALLAPDLTVLDCVSYGPQTVDVSEGRSPSGSASFGFFTTPTPGGGNPAPSNTNGASFRIVLNEVLANNGSIADTDGSITDWVELLAGPTNSVDLSGLGLSDDPAQPRRWVFPAGSVLAAGARLIVRFDSEKPATTNYSLVLNTGFGLAASGDQVYLFDTPERGGALLDSVSFGLQASDFSIGRIPDGTGPWQLNRATRAAPNLASGLASANALRINEWMADAGSGDDWFEVYNPNPQPVAIGGLSFTDDLAARAKSPIPPLSFIGTVTNGFARFAADSAPAKGADHVAFKLDKDGDLIALFPSGSGPAIHVISFGAQQEGISEGYFPDGGGQVTRFPRSPSPSESNFLPLDQVALSEALTHSDPPFEDAIELQNLSAEPIAIGGWFLSDSRNDLRKFRILPGTTLAPGGFAVFYEYQFNPEPGRGQSFSLSSARGDELFLSTADGGGSLTGLRTSVKFGPAANAVSFQRYETSVGPDFTASSLRSFGVDNPGTVEDFRTGQGRTNPPPRVGPVVLHEVMYHPPDVGTNDNAVDEFIELRNVGGATVDLFDPAFPTNTWRLRDAVDFEFPAGTSLPAGGYLLVVSFAPGNSELLTAFRARYNLSPAVAIFGPYRGKLDNSSDSVELLMPDAPETAPSPDAGLVPYVLVDRVKYADRAPWPSLADGNPTGLGYSLQRRVALAYGNDPVNWLAGAPTPGADTGGSPVALPTLTAGPVSQVVTEGSTTSFSCAAVGAAPLTYQWRFNGELIPGATSSNLFLSDVGLFDEGRYAVLVSNPAGAVGSAQVTLRLQTPPIITLQPQSRIVLAGANVTFSVAARGTSPLTFQWRRDGTPLPGQTGTNLVLNNIQSGNQGAYTVVITNLYGSVTSLVASLVINTPPVITTQPQARVVNAGDTVTFSVTLTGSPPFAYQWSFQGAPIPGENNPTLSLLNVQGTSGGGYSVSVTNAVGSVTSAVAALTVVLPPVVAVTAPDSIASEPGVNRATFRLTRSYATNTALSVDVLIDGTAGNGPDYTALSSPVTIAANQTETLLQVVPVNDTLKEAPETVRLTIAPGANRYTVAAQNSAVVTIFDDDNQPPAVSITQPLNGTLFPLTPTNVTLTASASDADGSVLRVEYFWAGTNKLGEATLIPFLVNWTDTPSGSNALVAVATDNLGASTTSAPVFLILNAPPTVALTNPVLNAGFLLGDDVVLGASASDADGNVARVEFFVDGTLLATDSASPYRATLPAPAAGAYNLTARAIDNRGATQTSSNVTVFVNVGRLALTDAFQARNTVLGSPLAVLGSNANTSAEEGEPNPLSARNDRTVWIAWTAPSSGATVIDTIGSQFDTVLAVYTGTSLRSLVTVAASDDDDGAGSQSLVSFNATAGVTYSIQVAGFSSSSSVGDIVLHITGALSGPLIYAQPQSRTVPVGANTTFTVGAYGTMPLGYQWQFNGAALPGAVAATLSLTNVQAAQEGPYSVVITNALGAVTSAVANLTVDDGLIRVQRFTLVPLHQEWKYNQSGVDPGPAWRLPSFNDSSWSIGQTLFGLEDTSPNPYFEPFRTTLRAGAGSPVTTLFRTRFLFTNTVGTITLSSENWVDDGAIYYLNGAEIGRLRMLSGVSNFFALAQSLFPEGQTNLLSFPAASLVSGENVLAVEVHQNTFSNPDVVFGMTLEATVTVTNAPVLRLLRVLPAGGFQLTLTGGITGRRYALESADLLGGGWTLLTVLTTVNGQAAYTDPRPVMNPGRFYRARVTP